MNFRKNSNGITLIALVVTIIILLILAGVNISLIAGGDGILAKAQSSVEQNNIAEAKERVALKIAEYQTDYYEAVYVDKEVAVTKKLGTWIAENHKNEIEVGDYKFEITGQSAPYDIKIKKNNKLKNDILGKLSEEGKVTWPKTTAGGGTGNSGEDEPDPTPEPATKYTVSYKVNGGTGTVPADVEYEEGDSVEVDFVNVPSHEGGTFAGWALSENAREATYKNGGTESFTMGTADVTLYAVYTYTQAYNSEHPELHIPTGFAYKEGSVSEGYVIVDNDGNEFVWIPVASSEAYTKKIGTNNWYMKTESSGTDTGLTVETAVKGDTLGVNTILEEDVTSTLDANQPEAKIVNAAGGFWVGRYEAGITNEPHDNIAGYSGYTKTEAATVLNDYWERQKGNVVVKANSEPVRNITQTKALSIANSWKSGTAGDGTVVFQSGLITGTQWDTMCNFIGWSTCDSSCVTWGNYKDVTSAQYTGYHSGDYISTWVYSENVIKNNSGSNRWIFPTGRFVVQLDETTTATTGKKNIFDVAGNVWEWTTEVPQYNASHCVLRGGGVYYSGSNGLATYRHGNYSGTTETNCDIGFRLVLYVK